MKKYRLYILVLFILVGLLSPIFSIYASKENPTEHCSKAIDLKTNQPANAPCAQPYAFLESLPGLKTDQPFYPSDTNAFGKYLNIIIKLFIGLCAVLAVVMIVIGGIEYATSELISSKEAGKDRILGALGGLLLALGAYTILFTINPDLLNTDIGIGGVTLTSEGEVLIKALKEFTISGLQTIDGKPGAKINFKAEACPVALAVEGTTGVKAAYLLAIFDQESSSGAQAFSGCSSTNASCVKWRPGTGDEQKLSQILAAMNPPKSPPVNVSPGGTAGGAHGGCMGYMQVCPSEWIRVGGLGKNPWNLNDSMTVAANLLVKEKGYNQNPAQSVCNYFGGCDGGGLVNYQASVLRKAAAFQDRINKGDCKP